MRPATLISTIGRPALSASVRARQTKKTQDHVNAKQWIGYIAVALATNWLTTKLDDLIERRFATSNQ